MNIYQRILIILIMIICIIGFMPQNISNANTIQDISQSFEAKDNDKVSYTSLTDIIGKLLGFLQIATGLISVVIIATTGYSYIVTTPPDLKGELKRKMLPVILGLMLVFSAVSIAKFIVGAIE